LQQASARAYCPRALPPRTSPSRAPPLWLASARAFRHRAHRARPHRAPRYSWMPLAASLLRTNARRHPTRACHATRHPQHRCGRYVPPCNGCIRAPIPPPCTPICPPMQWVHSCNTTPRNLTMWQICPPMQWVHPCSNTPAMYADMTPMQWVHSCNTTPRNFESHVNLESKATPLLRMQTCPPISVGAFVPAPPPRMQICPPIYMGAFMLSMCCHYGCRYVPPSVWVHSCQLPRHGCRYVPPPVWVHSCYFWKATPIRKAKPRHCTDADMSPHQCGCIRASSSATDADMSPH